MNFPFRRNSKYFFQMAIVTNILDFRSDQPKLFLIYMSPGYFLPRFESVGFSVCEKMSKTVFKMAAVAAILDFQSKIIELFFIYKSQQYYLPSFESAGRSVQEKKFKIYFQDGSQDGHLGCRIGTILASFDLQVTLIFPTNFRVSWPFGSGGDAQN